MHVSAVPLARVLWVVACVLRVFVAVPAAHPSARHVHRCWALEQGLQTQGTTSALRLAAVDVGRHELWRLFWRVPLIHRLGRAVAAVALRELVERLGRLLGQVVLAP